MPSKVKTGTAEPVVAAESVSCVESLDKEVGCAMGVAAAKASAEPMPPSMGMKETETKTVSVAGEIDPRPVQPSAVATEAEPQAKDLPGGGRKAVNPYKWHVCENIVKVGEVMRGSPPKTACSVRGTSPPKAVLSARGAGHEPTQGSAFGAGHERTQGSAFGAGHEPTQSSAFGARHEPT